MSRPVWLDITRLLERASVGNLTGIDRVELAYARSLLELAPDRVRFVSLHRWGPWFAALPDQAAHEFIDAVTETWRSGNTRLARAAAARLLAWAALSGPASRPSVAPVYLLVSHRHLVRETALARALRQAGATFIPLVHDLIPLTHPEYARPGDAEKHARRITTVARLADGVVVNSAATRAALLPYLPAGRPVHVAPLAVAPNAAAAAALTRHSYFLCVGTIEPRKNHLLLLHLWRRLGEAGAAPRLVPRLVIAGRRGWENENILDLLDRCPMLNGHVQELGPVSDQELATLLRGALALLMPSFAEGFGLPVAEALAAGTPVLASDLPALRETGGHVPEYFDPLDAPAWMRAVLDYAQPGSARRAAQIARMRHWRPATWEAHIAGVLRFADRIAGHAPVMGAEAARAA